MVPYNHEGAARPEKRAGADTAGEKEKNMSRNLKKDYLKKLLGISTENGYKIDIANYIYNPATDNDYPTLRKKIDETPEKITISQVYFMRFWDGTAEYREKIYTAPVTNETWCITSEVSERTLEKAGRFNLKRLQELAAAL